jgi:uncharacterized membrane protein YedE/YeeE
MDANHRRDNRGLPVSLPLRYLHDFDSATCLWRGIRDFRNFPFVVSLIGGILMGVGARWADGCTSGHRISGTLQLSLSSWTAVICFFAAGIIVAELIY